MSAAGGEQIEQRADEKLDGALLSSRCKCRRNLLRAKSPGRRRGSRARNSRPSPPPHPSLLPHGLVCIAVQCIQFGIDVAEHEEPCEVRGQGSACGEGALASGWEELTRASDVHLQRDGCCEV